MAIANDSSESTSMATNDNSTTIHISSMTMEEVNSCTNGIVEQNQIMKKRERPQESSKYQSGDDEESREVAQVDLNHENTQMKLIEKKNCYYNIFYISWKG